MEDVLDRGENKDSTSAAIVNNIVLIAKCVGKLRPLNFKMNCGTESSTNIVKQRD